VSVSTRTAAPFAVVAVPRATPAVAVPVATGTATFAAAATEDVAAGTVPTPTVGAVSAARVAGATAGVTGTVAVAAGIAVCDRGEASGAVALSDRFAVWLPVITGVVAAIGVVPPVATVIPFVTVPTTGAVTAAAVTGAVTVPGFVTAAVVVKSAAPEPPPAAPPVIAGVAGDVIVELTVDPGLTSGAGLIGSVDAGTFPITRPVSAGLAGPRTRPWYAWSAARTATASTLAAARSDDVIALAIGGGVTIDPDDAPGVDEGTVAGAFVGCPFPGLTLVVQPAAANKIAIASVLTALFISASLLFLEQAVCLIATTLSCVDANTYSELSSA